MALSPTLKRMNGLLERVCDAARRIAEQEARDAQREAEIHDELVKLGLGSDSDEFAPRQYLAATLAVADKESDSTNARILASIHTFFERKVAEEEGENEEAEPDEDVAC